MNTNNYLTFQRKMSLLRIATVLFGLLFFCSAYINYYWFNYLSDKVTLSLSQQTQIATDDLTKTLEHYQFDERKLLLWLSTHLSLYKLDDVKLQYAIEALCPTISTEDYHQYDSLLAQCNKQPLVAYLKDSAKNQQGIFQPERLTVRVSQPPIAFQPKIGYALTCFNSRWLGQSLRIFEHDDNHSIKVKVLGGFECKSHLKYPDLQLNQVQFSQLFSDAANSVKLASVISM